MKHSRTLLLATLTVVPLIANAKLVAWFPLSGSPVEALTGVMGKFVGDSNWGAADSRKGADFRGMNGALFFQDSNQYVLGHSFSVSATVWIRENPTNGTSPAGQIVFRGDDRGGLDNYTLNVSNDGYYSFNFYNDANDNGGVGAPATKNKWQTLLGTFDSETKAIKLFVDGVLVAESSAPLIPVTKMESGWTPGLSIGNVQNPLGGCHNQPFNGIIRDVRLYDNAIFWDDLRKMPIVSGQSGRSAG